MSAQGILNKLQGVKRAGNGWTARCPAHGDEHNSLSVSNGDNGSVLLYCHAGCSYNAICSALGIKKQNNHAKGSCGVIASYDYQDEEGNVLFQVCRCEPKSFFQRRPDGKGGYIKGLNGTRRVLYGLPELLEADPNVTVFVVEGEKDVEALRESGLVATCNPGGAGKWRNEYNEILRGRRIVLLPDNDVPGHEHMDKVMRSLCNIAASIKIIPLPGLPDKGDVSDWLSAGGTVEQLLELVERTSEREDAQALMCSFGNFMRLQAVEGEMIGFELRRRELGLIASITNVGKSTLLRNALLSLATGGEFLPLIECGMPRSVGLLDFETSASRLQEDLYRMTRDWSDYDRRLLDEHFFIICEGMIGDDMLSLSHHLDAIEREARAHKIDLLAVDTAGAAFDLWNENDNGEVARRISKPLLKMARKLDCAVVMAHHIGKPKSEEGSASAKIHRPRGASAFTGYATSAFVLEADTNNSGAVALTCAKRKSGAMYEVTLRLDRTTRWFTTTGTAARIPTNYELVIKAVTEAGGPVKRAEIEAVLNGKVKRATVTRCLSDAVLRGELLHEKHGLYMLPTNAQMLTPIRDEHLSI